MDTEREKDKRLLSQEEARELLAEAWLSFWMSGRTRFDSETRNQAVRGVLERLSPLCREYFLKEKDEGSELARIREGARLLARTGQKDTLSVGKKRHIRREKAAKHGTNPKRIH